MDQFLKRGLLCMLAAVVLMPAATLVKSVSENLTLLVLLASMILELIGLVFVVLSILKRRREANYDQRSKAD